MTEKNDIPIYDNTTVAIFNSGSEGGGGEGRGGVNIISAVLSCKKYP